MLASSLVGGLLGGSSGGGEQTQTRTLDPRLANYIFGTDGKGGLLGDAQSLHTQQMQNGGLNARQRQGLDMQMQYLTSPQYQQGNQAMYNSGMSLMGGGVAANPFTTGQASLSGGVQRMPGGMGMQQPAMQPGRQTGIQQPSQGFQYQPIQAAPAADYSRQPPAPQAVTQTDFEAWLTDYLNRQNQSNGSYGQGSGDGYGGGFGGGYGDGGSASDGGPGMSA